MTMVSGTRPQDRKARVSCRCTLHTKSEHSECVSKGASYQDQSSPLPYAGHKQLRFRNRENRQRRVFFLLLEPLPNRVVDPVPVPPPHFGSGPEANNPS